jgi:hypothetical protein
MTRPLCRGLLLAVVAAAGCQNGKPPYTLAPVEGTVRKDGQPLPGVIVVFWGDDDAIKGPLSACPTDSAGHYRLHTEQGRDGALVGRHRVCIVETGALVQRFLGRKSANKQLTNELPAAGPSVVPPAYGRRDQTPLRAEVPAGGQVLDFEVK